MSPERPTPRPAPKIHSASVHGAHTRAAASAAGGGPYAALLNDEEFISAVAEPARDAHAQKTNPKLKAPPRTFSILLPDLLVESVEADPTGKVKEDVEFNNWMESNPNRAPFPPDGTTYCKPKS